jgi:hypothetical protein
MISFMYIIVNTLHKGENKDNNDNIFKPKHNVLRVFVLRTDAREFIWILVRSELNTRITYICFYFISIFIIYIVEVTSSIFTQFCTLTVAPSLCDAIEVEDLCACKCLVWFRMYCVYFLLINLGRGGSVDKTIILRNAAANGPIVPSQND